MFEHWWCGSWVCPSSKGTAVRPSLLTVWKALNQAVLLRITNIWAVTNMSRALKSDPSMPRTQPARKTSSSEGLVSPLALGLGNNHAALQISVQPYPIIYLKCSRMANYLSLAVSDTWAGLVTGCGVGSAFSASLAVQSQQPFRTEQSSSTCHSLHCMCVLSNNQLSHTFFS